MSFAFCQAYTGAFRQVYMHVYVAGQNEIQVKMKFLCLLISQFPLSSNPNYS